MNFNVWILKVENWNLKFVCEMFGKFWELKCLNWDVWILKAENWKLKCLNLDVWILKVEISLWNVWKESKILKIEMSKYKKLKTKMSEY